MKVLVVGSGGREHALCAALARGGAEVVAALGNPGCASVARCEPVAVSDLAGLVALATRESVDLVVVGPEAPLVAGLVDRLRAEGVLAFGPTAEAARLEGSKSFVKAICEERAIPTAASRSFSSLAPALSYLREAGAPLVVKVDGLAAGKGVTVAESAAEAEAAVRAALADGRFGDAGRTVLLEERLTGPELSFFALCDGSRALPFMTAMDHKRLGDGDVGPNTGGMGAVCPHPLTSAALEAELLERFVTPTLDAMRARGAPFTGVLYAGVMLTPEGPKLLEYNVRFGDPECQAVLARFDGDLAAALHAAARGALDEVELRWGAPASVSVVMAAPGYPDAPRVGDAIDLSAVDPPAGAALLHAGTRVGEGGALLSAGGRVLNAVATGETVSEAAARAYAVVDQVRWPGARVRRDIGAPRW